MNKLIFGHVVCQNAIADILRSIESLQGLCDVIYVADGGSTDGTRELLEERKDIYKLKIFDHPFTTLLKQRQYLLEQTPTNHWVVVLDQDERLSFVAQHGIRPLIKSIDDKLYDNRELPLVITINHYNLIGDTLHYIGDSVPHNMRIFWNDKKLMWGGPDYHCYLVHKDKQDRHFVDLLPALKGFAILHYARLDPKRIRERQERLNDPKWGGYSASSWKETKANIREIPVECL